MNIELVIPEDLKVCVTANPISLCDEVVSFRDFDITKSFTCRCCGTHYIARDPGFVPNCHNCGSVMQAD